MQPQLPVGVARMPRPHLVYDFNGTLLDDNRARLRALNDSLAALDRAPIDLAEYRRTFCVPVPRFYARLFGRPLTEAEWLLADGVFQRNYPGYARTESELMPGAKDALSAWAAAGNTQSLLSLHTHTELLAEVERLRIAEYFTVVDGRRGPTGGTKADAMRSHVARLPAAPGQVVAIGDTADDALAARSAGIAAVLFSSGAQLARELTTAGVPVTDSLPEAVGIARALIDGRHPVRASAAGR